jgi:hypothetical protein
VSGHEIVGTAPTAAAVVIHAVFSVVIVFVLLLMAAVHFRMEMIGAGPAHDRIIAVAAVDVVAAVATIAVIVAG